MQGLLFQQGLYHEDRSWLSRPALLGYLFMLLQQHRDTQHNLDTFSMSKFGPMDSLILDAPNLKELYLCSEELYIAEVFSGVSKTSTLHMDDHEEPSELDFENLPWFHNLTCLQLKAFSDLKLGFVLGMLNHCPNLQNLILHFDCDIHGCDWMLPDSVPHCLLSSLKEFELCADDLCESDVDILKYFLKNGMAMEEMKLNGLKMGSKEKRARF